MSPHTASAAQRAPAVGFRNICSPDLLLNRLQVMNKRIAKRASEISQAAGRKQGYAQEDWLQAQSEFLRPIPVEIEELADKFRVRASILGFEQDELQVSIEPARIIIAGKKENQPAEGNRLFYVDWYPDEILQMVELPKDIEPALAHLTFEAGVLEFDLLKPLEWPEWALGVMDG